MHSRKTGRNNSTFVSQHEGDPIMRPYAIAGLILIILGVLALSVHSITYFTTEHVAGPLGFFAWEVSRPHTIVINPIVGIVALVLGIVLAMMGRRAKSV
jgi:membrane-bound ClpP family serine protease